MRYSGEVKWGKNRMLILIFQVLIKHVNMCGLNIVTDSEGVMLSVSPCEIYYTCAIVFFYLQRLKLSVTPLCVSSTQRSYGQNTRNTRHTGDCHEACHLVPCTPCLTETHTQNYHTSKNRVVTVPRPVSFSLSHYERAEELRHGGLMCLGLDGSPSAACKLKVGKQFIDDLTSEAVGAFNSTYTGCIESGQTSSLKKGNRLK